MGEKNESVPRNGTLLGFPLRGGGKEESEGGRKKRGRERRENGEKKGEFFCRANNGVLFLGLYFSTCPVVEEKTIWPRQGE